MPSLYSSIAHSALATLVASLIVNLLRISHDCHFTQIKSPSSASGPQGPAQSACYLSQFSSVQSLSCLRLFATPWTAACQASLSITSSQSLLKLMSIALVMPSNHLILCRPLLLPSIFPCIRVFSNESILHIRWPKYWSTYWPVVFIFQHHIFLTFHTGVHGVFKKRILKWFAIPFSSGPHFVRTLHPPILDGSTWSAWRDEWCWQVMMQTVTQGVGLHVYFNHQVFFYTLTKALIRGFTFSAPPHPVIVSLLPFKQSSCFSDSLRIMFTCGNIVTHAYVWAAYHIPQFISYLSKSCLPLVS